MQRTAEQLRALAGPEFNARLAADPELAELQRHLHDRDNIIPGVLAAMMMQPGQRIGSLPVRCLTAAKWAFLWMLKNPLVRQDGKTEDGSAQTISQSELDVFLFVLSREDLRNLDLPLASIPGAASGYAAATGLEPERLLAELRTVIEDAFEPLSMLPPSGGGSGEMCFDGSWLAWIGGVAARESLLPYDRCIHELPLSLVCDFFVSWRKRESVDGDKIKRPPRADIMEKISARIEEMSDDFLNSENFSVRP